MSDYNHRHSFLSQLLHQLKNFSDHLRIKRRCRLVKQDHIRIHCKRTNDRNSLLLTSRQCRRVNVRFVFKSDSSEQFKSLLFRLAFDLFFCRCNWDKFFFFASEYIFKPDHSVFIFCFFQILALQICRSHHYVLKNCFIIEQIKMLKYHTHMAAMHVDIDFHIRDIDSFKNNASGCRIFHTI